MLPENDVVSPSLGRFTITRDWLIFAYVIDVTKRIYRITVVGADDASTAVHSICSRILPSWTLLLRLHNSFISEIHVASIVVVHHSGGDEQ